MPEYVGRNHILIVDDDVKILKLLKQFFNTNDFLVSIASCAKDAQQLIQYFAFDLMILDVMLPNITGFEFARDIRCSKNNMPIIMLTALSTPNERIEGLESGASDYLTKPFEPKELLLRVQNLINLYNKHKIEAQQIFFGEYRYSADNAILLKNNEIINITSSEQNLLNFLIRNANKICLREEISLAIGKYMQDRSVDVHVTRLRSKIEADPKNPRYLKTIRNLGYILYL